MTTPHTPPPAEPEFLTAEWFAAMECDHEFTTETPSGSHEWCQKCDLIRPVAAGRGAAEGHTP